MQTESKRGACPFCGETIALHVSQGGYDDKHPHYFVRCGACDADGPSCQEGPMMAWTLWNERRKPYAPTTCPGCHLPSPNGELCDSCYHRQASHDNGREE